MRRKSNTGLNFLLFMILMVGAGLLVRFKCKAKDKSAPKPEAPIVEKKEPPPPIEKPVEKVVEPLPSEPEEPIVRGYMGPQLEIGALSADGSKALLVSLVSERGYLRVVDVVTGKVDGELDFEALHEIDDPNSEAVLTELAKARTLLRDFPLGASKYGKPGAASADGTKGAFNNGDLMYLVEGDKLGAKVAFPAAYDPMVTKDNMLVVRGYDGRIDDEGKYSLFSLPLAGGKPKKIAGTDGFTGRWAYSAKKNAVRIVVSHGEAIKTCVLDVALDKPMRVTSKVCPEGASYTEVELSPSGDWIAWQSNEGEQTRLRSMELATKKTDLDVFREGHLIVSDDGHVIMGSDAWDPKKQHITEVESSNIDYQCVFRNATELVCPDGAGSVTLEKI